MSTVGDVLTVVGAAVELGGVAITAVGLASTWKEFRDPEDRFRALVSTQLDRVTLWLSRVFRHPLPQVVRTVGVGSAVSVSDSVGVETSWGPLPSLQENPTEFARVLNDRLGDLNKRSWHALNAVGTVRAELATSRRELEAEVVRLRSEANANVQRVAVGGVLLSSFGLLLLAVGLGLQTAGDLM